MTALQLDPAVTGEAGGGRLNIADRVRVQARLRPHARAVIAPAGWDASGRRAYVHLTFAQLEEAIDTYARGLAALGVRPGMRALFMVKPSLEFFGLTFALFRLGAAPVMIDPAMGKHAVLGAVAESEPEAFIAIPKGHVARLAYGRAFASVKVNVTVGPRLFWGGATLDDVERLGRGGDAFETAATRAGDLAAILFTSGSTGAPKGVLYTHGIFDAQVEVFERVFGIEPGEVELSAFPLFSLFSVALGASVVIPDMDATKPAEVDPQRILEAVRDQGVTYAFGSPAFWRRVGDWCEARGERLESLRRVLMAGAPAPVPLLERLLRIIPERADVFTPYGATECLPITLPSARALLEGPAQATREGKGTCVGRPIPGTEVRIIAVSDGPLERVEDAACLGPGEIGEIVVRSPLTTQGYFRRPRDDARSKLRDEGGLWHRMGDVGYLDREGRLWFSGRKAHRVDTAEGRMFSVHVEALFDAHPRVFRSALVGVGERGRERPVLIVEAEPASRPSSKREEEALRAELFDLGARSPLSAPVKDILFHPAFPVDARHNAKIRREVLAVWAAERLGVPHRSDDG